MKKGITKKRLLDATLKLISEKGYIGATTREIAHEAGVTELTLFRHFGTKERLFEELLKNHTFLPRLKELLPELDGLSYEDSLRLIATRFLLSLKERKSMVKIMYSEVTIYPEKIKKLYNKFIDDLQLTLASYFRGLQKKGLLRNVSPEMAAKLFLGILFSYFRSEEIMRKGGMKKQKMEKNIEEFVDIFIFGTIKHD
ncbi:MAG: TetR/AcrR family transcriptional regulator [Nitrospirae bacterium]|nr:TetR/AcrR family transcriptional regulator [Nitrospirota bacterium]